VTQLTDCTLTACIDKQRSATPTEDKQQILGETAVYLNEKITQLKQPKAKSV